MELFKTLEPSSIAGATCLAESGEFALYARDRDSYLLVQKHQGTPWEGISISGDGVFRIGGLLVEAMRHLYRDVASDVHLIRQEKRSTT
jgi:hypothetical protein